MENTLLKSEVLSFLFFLQTMQQNSQNKKNVSFRIELKF